MAVMSRRLMGLRAAGVVRRPVRQRGGDADDIRVPVPRLQGSGRRNASEARAPAGRLVRAGHERRAGLLLAQGKSVMLNSCS